MPSIPDPLSGLDSLLGGTVKSLAGDAFQSIAKDFAAAAGKAATWLWEQIGSATAVSLGGPGFDRLLAIVTGIAVVVGMGLFAVQIITSVLRRDAGGLARAAKGLLVAFVGEAAAIAVTDVLLNAVDAISNGIVQTATGASVSRLGQAIISAGAVTSLTNPAAMLVLALIVIAAVVFIWAALMIRKLLIVIAAVFAPAAFAGSLADISTGWVKKWIEGMAALIASKLILVIMLLVGYYMLADNLGATNTTGTNPGNPTATQAVTQVAAGGIVLLLAAFAPWVALKTVHFAGEHMAALHTHATSATTGATTAISAPQKLSAMIPTSPTRSGGPGGPGRSGVTVPTGPPRNGAGPGGGAGPAGAAGAAGGFGTGAPGGVPAGTAAASSAANGVASAGSYTNGNGTASPSAQTPGSSPPPGSPFEGSPFGGSPSHPMPSQTPPRPAQTPPGPKPGPTALPLPSAPI
ncbi:MAG: hypothetical protein ACP5P1_12525 [Acidimicrobiales bacterium]